MARSDDLDRILREKIVAVMRFDRGEPLIQAARALISGGVTIMEVTFTVPQAHKVLEQLAEALGDQVLLGAGTVLDAPTARIALLAGARFLVCPHLDRRIIELGHRYDALVIPGAFTATEVLQAWQSGAAMVKIFPADVGGPAYLRALRGPLPQVRLMPTGGVNLKTAADFLQAGASALGVGGALVEPRAVEAGDWKRIEELARQFVHCVAQCAHRDGQI